MNYNYLKKNYYVIIVFIIFFNLKLEIKKLTFLFLALSYFLYIKKNEYDEKKKKLKSYPKLENLNDELLNFYSDNTYLTKFDSVNFNESLNYTKKFIELYNNITDSPLKYYEYDLLNNYKLNSIKSFQNIEYSIPLNSFTSKKFINEINKLFNILSAYQLKIINHKNITIYTKFNENIKAFNFS